MKLDRREFLSVLGSASAATAVADRFAPWLSIALAAPVSTGAASDLGFMPARELADLVRTRKVSVRDVMVAHLKQIGRVNPKINALPWRMRLISGWREGSESGPCTA